MFKKLKLRFLDGHFRLSKWRTNDPKLREIFSENTSNSLQPEKLLGILWEEADDMLVFDFSEIREIYKTLDITKRNVYKILAMFYDLTGLLQPILINNLKRLFQEICKQKLSWDELLPDDFRNEFKKIMLSLQDMEKISITRNVLPKTNCQLEIELHGFNDASLQSYGACVYIRAVSKSGVSSVHLVASKSRLTPIKSTTIPRLELLGNVLLSRLMTSVKNALSKIINISNYFYWTDSMVTLARITSKGKNFYRKQDSRNLREH